MTKKRHESDTMLQALAEEFSRPITLPLPIVALRLSMAVLLGGIIGWEREIKARAAGLRTTMLVCLAAALAMLPPGAYAADLIGQALRLPAHVRRAVHDVALPAGELDQRDLPRARAARDHGHEGDVEHPCHMRLAHRGRARRAAPQARRSAADPLRRPLAPADPGAPRPRCGGPWEPNR